MRHWLELRRFWLRSLRIEASGSHGGPSHETDLQTKFGLELGKPNQQPEQFFVIPLVLLMEFESPPEHGPFAVVSSRVEAHFSIPWATPTYLVTRDLLVNMLTIVYGNLRGVIASATGVCRSGPFWLPTISMDALFADFCESNQNSPLLGIEDLKRDFTELRRKKGFSDEDESQEQPAPPAKSVKKSTSRPSSRTSRPRQ